MNDAAPLGVWETAAAIRSGRLTAEAAVAASLARIAEWQPVVNAFIRIEAEAALARARALDRAAAAGDCAGPLHGVPLAHKDMFAREGGEMTGGSAILPGHPQPAPAPAVSRLEAAGAITVGWLNMSEFAAGPTGHNVHFGHNRNPWNPLHVTGGSSAGSGAAVAARMVAGALGSDTGGSIRLPAAMNGLVGLKPTYGRVSRAGVFPLCWSMDHAGPMARSVRDLALMLGVMAGHDPRDEASAERPVPDYTAALTGELKGLRIGLPRRYFFEQAEPAVLQAVEAALAVFERRGATLVEVEVAAIEHAAAAALVIYLAEATAWHEDTLDRLPELYAPAVRDFLELGDQVLAKDYLLAQRYRTHLGRSLQACFEQVDLLAMPTLPVVATPFGTTAVEVPDGRLSLFSALLRNCEPFNLTGLPALSLPCGFAGGLPVGLQLVGPAFAEPLVLAAGDAYQRVTDWHRAQPPASS